MATEKPVIWIKKTHRKKRAGEEQGWSLSFLGSEIREVMCLLRCLWSKSRVSWLVLSFSELADFHRSLWLLSFIDKKNNRDLISIYISQLLQARSSA